MRAPKRLDRPGPRRLMRGRSQARVRARAHRQHRLRRRQRPRTRRRSPRFRAGAFPNSRSAAGSSACEWVGARRSSSTDCAWRSALALPLSPPPRYFQRRLPQPQRRRRRRCRRCQQHLNRIEPLHSSPRGHRQRPPRRSPSSGRRLRPPRLEPQLRSPAHVGLLRSSAPTAHRVLVQASA